VNPVVHWELFAADAPALARFYAALFGWAPQPLPDIGYVLIDTCAGAGISGGIATVPDRSCQPMFYISADDLEATLDRVHQAGGTTAVPPRNEVVTFAQFADPEGNIVGLLKRGDESPVSGGDAPAVSRFHLSATDPAALVAFYQQVFRWRARPGVIHGDTQSLEVDTGTGGIAGAIGTASPGRPAVMFSATVDDLGTCIERARALGAAAEPAATGPTEEVEAAYIVDPAGQTLELLSSRHASLRRRRFHHS
jgi:predicted enzyme related to lactoylglutathione lyase